MKTIGSILILISVLIFANEIRLRVVSNYAWEKQYSNLWELADKSSTIPAKQQYIAQFVSALKAGQTNGVFSEYNAVFLKTPNNQFSANLKAVETLSNRLMEIQEMDPKTFEYNTAIQQITAQEQGEAHQLVAVLQGCFDLNNYFLVWNWVGTAVVIGAFVILMIGFFLCFWEVIGQF